ncbi:MAG: precorrin-2 C(20)-methyltransferase [Oscillatoriales cyanobacterium SM2_2_1]|nr:precorrin-2 C(20)-methyltransferase [Oscillatoriales cyanobacterium SM2_2_1]
MMRLVAPSTGGNPPVTPTLGKVYGIGVGNGDPEQLTIRGYRVLRQADVLAFPAGPKGQPGIAQAMLRLYGQSHQELLPLQLPLAADHGVLRAAWQTAVINMLPYVRAGKTLAFMAEGDLGLYSSFAFIMHGLKERHPDLVVEMVPGVSSAIAAAARLGIPLTTGADRLIILPQLRSLEELAAALDWAEVVVLLDVAPVYREVWELLAEKGLLSLSQVIAWNAVAHHRVWSDLTFYAQLNLPRQSLLWVRRSLTT